MLHDKFGHCCCSYFRDLSEFLRNVYVFIKRTLAQLKSNTALNKAFFWLGSSLISSIKILIQCIGYTIGSRLGLGMFFLFPYVFGTLIQFSISSMLWNNVILLWIREYCQRSGAIQLTNQKKASELCGVAHLIGYTWLSNPPRVPRVAIQFFLAEVCN